MKLISSLQFFFLMEMYSASRFTKIELAPRKPDWRITDPKKEPPRSHIKPRQALIDNFIIHISKNPRQPMKLKFDTGSRDMWVLSERYDTCDKNYDRVQNIHRRYNSTSPNLGESRPKLMTYLGEFAFGYMASEVLLIVGYEVNKTFLEVTKASKYLTDWEHDGVMGLQYDPKIRHTYSNPIAEVCDKWNTNRAFSFSYPRNISEPGNIVICGANSNWFNGYTLHVFKESNPGTWLLSVTNVMFGDIVIKADTKLLIRTELYGIRAPQKDISKIIGEVQSLFPEIGIGSQFDCTHVPRLPYLDFVMNGIHIGISGDYYSRKVYNATTGTRCKLDFYSGPEDYWSVGDNFLRKYYVMFDMDGNNVAIFLSTR